MTTYESEIKVISQPQEMIFNTLSNLSNFQKVKEMNLEGQDKFSEYLKDMECSEDAVLVSVPTFGKVGLRIIEREPFKTIKLQAENSPVAANAWIQLVAISENETKMRITVKAELPMMIKMMVDSKLKKGVDALADGLAKALNAGDGSR